MTYGMPPISSNDPNDYDEGDYAGDGIDSDDNDRSTESDDDSNDDD